MQKSSPRILVVEDEEMIRRMFVGGLKEYRIDQAATGGEALILVESGQYQAALVDLMLPDINGLEVLCEIKKIQPRCQVIVMTGHASIPLAIRSIRMGAMDFIEKPFSLNEIRRLMEKAVISSGGLNGVLLSDETAKLARQAGIAGHASREMQELLASAHKIAGKKLSVLLCGETGTGKELLARFIHLASPRSGRIFLPVNCGALAESLVESDLFGHEKGAFTGADRRRHGCFELADRGTIFLDEVGDSSSGVQSRLLRVLETGDFQRVGGEEILNVDVRVLAATNIDLEKAVQKRLFRQDLYYRLGAVRLNVPPLRRRREDILPLADHFLRRVSGVEDEEPITLSHEAAEMLLNYPWPGNVRELANVIYQAATMAEVNTIALHHLPDRLLSGRKQFTDRVPPEGNSPPARLKDIEKSAIISALQYCRGNIKATALVLGIGRATMHRKIKEYGIDLNRAVYPFETKGPT